MKEKLYDVTMDMCVFVEQKGEKAYKSRASVVVFTGTKTNCLNYLKMQYIDIALTTVDLVNEVEIELSNRRPDEIKLIVASKYDYKSNSHEVWHSTYYRIEKHRSY